MPELETLSLSGRKPRGKATHPDLTKPQAGEGHNFAPADRITMFASQLRQLEDKKSEIADQIKKVRQRAKNAGLGLDAMKRGEKLASMDPANAQAWLEETIHYAEAFDVEVNPKIKQLKLFDMGDGDDSEEAKQQRAMRQAYNFGKRLALMEKPSDDQKYHPNSPLGQEHLRGYAEGEKILTAFAVEQEELDEKETAEAEARAKEKIAKSSAPKPAKAAKDEAEPKKRGHKKKSAVDEARDLQTEH